MIQRRHALTVRVTHWINAIALILLLMSGLQIFNAHPSLYWGQSSYTGAGPIFELADGFCKQSRLRVEKLFDALWTNTDAEDRRTAAGVLEGRYEWLERGVLDPSEGTGPWISRWEPGPSTETNVARRIIDTRHSV